MNIEEHLKFETEKWLGKLENLDIRGDGEFTENIKAYISDARYFMENGDMVRAFEAVIWAWAWYEIGEKLGKLDKSR